MSDDTSDSKKESAETFLKKIGDAELPLEDICFTAHRQPSRRWDNKTTSILKTLFDSVLSGRIEDFAFVVATGKNGEGKLFYKSSNGRELLKWALNQKEE